MAIPLSDNIYTESNKPSDARYGPYASTSLAKSSVPVPYRHIGLVVGIIEEGSTVEYWWESNTSDEGLVVKKTGSNIDDLTTDDLNEGESNQYFTEARAIASKLVGYAKATAVSAITATTSILEAIGILEKALDDKVDKEEGHSLLADEDQLKIDAINLEGDGSKFLTDDGTYKSELNPRTYIEESASGSVSIDLANKDIVHVEMSDNITSFDVENHVVGKTYKIYMIQDSIGNRTLTGLDPKFKTENDIPILLSTDQNAVDLLQLDVFSETDIKIYPVYNI